MSLECAPIIAMSNSNNNSVLGSTSMVTRRFFTYQQNLSIRFLGQNIAMKSYYKVMTSSKESNESTRRILPSNEVDNRGLGRLVPDRDN